MNLYEYFDELFESIIKNNPQLNFPSNYKEIIDYKKLEEIILNQSKNDVKEGIKEIFKDLSDNKKFAQELGKIFVGNEANIETLLMLEDLEQRKISFSSTNYDENYEKLNNCLGDSIEIIDILKNIYDTVFLKKLFKNSDNTLLSDEMVKKYKEHEEDLRFLKNLFKDNRNLYNKLLKTEKEPCIYDKYTHNKLTYEEFIKELEKLVGKLFDNKNNAELNDKWLNIIKPKIDRGEFLPRITETDNGRFPYQLNKAELIKIIENQGKYYPFLKEKINNKYKIVILLEFKIPYYIGPLNNTTSNKNQKNQNAWMIRKENNVKITPYNFEKVIDKEKTAEEFIMRMISHCTYLLDEYALPNNSILYSKFKVLNELKQIKVNGYKLEKELLHKVLEELFMKESGAITEKKFIQYLKNSNRFEMYRDKLEITGYSADKKFANNMQPYIDFFGENGIFDGTNYNEEEAEKIIKWITIFEDKDILKSKVEREFPKLAEKKVKTILNKKYNGWGSLSKKLLTELYYKDKKTETSKSILTLMYETEENFMQIINNDEYNFQKLININNNNKDNIAKVDYELVKNLATSPTTKKGIFQSLKVVEEIINYMGYEPESIMIEMARSDDKKKQRKDDKKKHLQNIYNQMKKDKKIVEFKNYETINSQLKETEKIDSQKLFLYFIQEGKCLYTGKPLNIEDLNSYEVDHILPQTLIKDNSIDNKALVLRECNQTKGASFVLPREYRTEYMQTWWKHLKDVGLISAAKLYRLTRKSYSDEDIQGFINRQLVETRQITKHVANIISNLYKNTKVIYLKANLSHNYREKYELYKFREINDYHHAHDAYLTAVLGEYKEKYINKNFKYEMIKDMNTKLKDLGNYKELKYGFVINSLDETVNDIVLKMSDDMVNNDTGEIIFDTKEFNNRVEETLYRNDILMSRKTEIRSGILYKETMYKKGKGKIKIKENMPVEIYGGYLNIENSYLTLVKYKKNQKLVGIPIEIEKRSQKNQNMKINFIKNHLNTIESITILQDNIPFETEIKFKNQNVYIKGYSNANKNNELSNALQLKISKEKQKRWKRMLNVTLNNKGEIENPEEIEKYQKEFLKFLFSQKENYPLFKNEINKIAEKIKLDKLSFENYREIIQEMLKIYHCNSVNGNLKKYGLSDRIGRLSGKSIDSLILISKSVTGIKEREINYEF